MSTIDELRKLLEAATPAPWSQVITAAWRAQGPHVLTQREAEADAALIAALRNAAPELLAVVEAARALVACPDCEDAAGGHALQLRAALAKLDEARA